jgi:hypothetical protein
MKQIHALAGLAALLSCSPSLCAQEESPAPQDPLQQMRKLFEENGIRLDAKQKSITVDAEVGRPDQPLEFLLIHQRGKTHESLFVCKAKASVLNAAFLALGYEKGENARVVDRDPLPTPEEVAKGAPIFDVFPPKGMNVWFTVRWTRVNEDGDEVQMEAPVEDLVLDLVTEKPVADASFIYLGGNMAPMYRDEPPVFMGDYEGNLISVVYKSPPNHLVTMHHERANDDQIWWYTEACPPIGTPVEFVIHRQEPAAHKARRERLAKEKAVAEEKAGGQKGGADRKDGEAAPERG